MTKLAIESPEYAERIARLRIRMEAAGLDAFAVFHPIRVAYLTGFFHQITERPIVLRVGLGHDACEPRRCRKAPSSPAGGNTAHSRE